MAVCPSCHAKREITDPPVNEARALRVTEIINDFRTLQHNIIRLQVLPPAGEGMGRGYEIMRQCAQEAQVLLSRPFELQAMAPGNSENQKAQLQRHLVILPVYRLFGLTLLLG